MASMLRVDRSISLFDIQIHSLGTEKELVNLDIQKLWYDLHEKIEGMDIRSAEMDLRLGRSVI